MILKNDQHAFVEIGKEIRRTHTKLMKLYNKLDELGGIDTSYIKLWLEAQQNVFDPNVDCSKPYWIN